MNKILSVAVAAHNMERYLEQCLSSLVIKPYMNALDIRIIDDGSSDRTPEIARRFASEYPDTFSLTSLVPNRGYGSAVQKGIEHAKGKYFMVVDADDMVDSNRFRGFLDYLKQCDADMLLLNKVVCLDDEKEISWMDIKEGNFIFNKILPMDDAAGTLWDFSVHHMIIKTEILHNINICLDAGFYTDIELTFFPLPSVRTVAVSDKFFKIYRRREGQSTTDLNFYRHRKDFETVLLRLANSMSAFRQIHLSSEHMRFLEFKLQCAFAFYFNRMLNVPLSIEASELSQAIRDLYNKIKPEFDRMKRTDFGFLQNLLITFNFHCFFVMRVAKRNFNSLVIFILPQGTRRRMAVKRLYFKMIGNRRT